MILGTMVPFRRQRPAIPPTLRTCACGVQEMSSSGNWQRCSACRRAATKKQHRLWYEQVASMSGQQPIVRLDGWCWVTGWRGARLQELEQQLGHTKWVGPAEARV